MSAKTVDIQGGMHTYGQHLALIDELVKYSKLENPTPLDRVNLMFKLFKILDYEEKNAEKQREYFAYICESIKMWAERGAKLLKHESTTEEKAAGADKLAELSGSFGVIKHIAKNYHYKLDEVLQLEWVNVFTLLYIERLEAEYERRLWKQHEIKMKTKYGKHGSK